MCYGVALASAHGYRHSSRDRGIPLHACTIGSLEDQQLHTCMQGFPTKWAADWQGALPTLRNLDHKLSAS